LRPSQAFPALIQEKIDALAWKFKVFRSIPLKITDPDVGRSSPAHKPRRVVLPLPEGPTMAQREPSSIERDTSRRTVRVLSPLRYVLVKFSTWSREEFFISINHHSLHRDSFRISY